MSTGSFDISVNDYMIFNIYGDKKEGQVGQLVLYEGMGKEVWRKKINWVWSGQVTISDKGKYVGVVAITSDWHTILNMFSNDGELQWKYKSGNCDFMDFSPDENYLAAGINLNDLHLFESATGKIVWNYKLDNTRSFYSIAVSDNGKFVTAADGGGRRELPASNFSTIFLFDKKGNIVWQKELKIQKERVPDVRFSDGGKRLLISNGNKLCCYRITGGGR